MPEADRLVHNCTYAPPSLIAPLTIPLAYLMSSVSTMRRPFWLGAYLVGE